MLRVLSDDEGVASLERTQTNAGFLLLRVASLVLKRLEDAGRLNELNTSKPLQVHCVDDLYRVSLQAESLRERVRSAESTRSSADTSLSSTIRNSEEIFSSGGPWDASAWELGV